MGIAAPYQFTEGLYGGWDWVLPAIIVCSGTFLNARFTLRIPLILSWLAAFALQAAVRSLLFGTAWSAALLPMTGVAFVLFTFYMVTDPATTPASVPGSGAVRQARWRSGLRCARGHPRRLRPVLRAEQRVCAARMPALGPGMVAGRATAVPVPATVRSHERAVGRTHQSRGSWRWNEMAVQQESRN